RRAGRPDPRRDRLSLPRPAARPRQEERARIRRPHGGVPGRDARGGSRRARAAHRRQRPRRPRSRVTVRAKKELGQHFLVDENILGVIGRQAELDESDVVLEIGPGLGVLTTFLADRVQQVYAVELDLSLGPQLVDRVAGRPNVQLRSGDALRLYLRETAPGATKPVAHLP